MNTLTYQELLAKNPQVTPRELNEVSYWEILSIDEKSLGIVHGKFRDIIKYALTLPNFATSNKCGTIEKVAYVKPPLYGKIFHLPKEDSNIGRIS